MAYNPKGMIKKKKRNGTKKGKCKFSLFHSLHYMIYQCKHRYVSSEVNLTECNEAYFQVTLWRIAA